MNIPDIIRDMTPVELAVACTYERASIKNIFAQELCRRAGLLPKYQKAHTDAAAGEVIRQAAKGFGILLI